MVQHATNRLRLAACWGFSIAAHALILCSAGLWVTDLWTLEQETPAPSIDVTLSLPAENAPPLQSTHFAAPDTRHRVLSDTQFETRDANYLNTWRRYIESVGTQQYKQALKAHPQMKGSLTVRVTIDAYGALKAVKIEKSSGSKDLDQLALNIVRKAAPFKPLPDAMKKDTDTLDILRTWQFD